MEKQLTAVEWLENEFQEICKDFGGLHSDFIVKFKQAKAMEKQQIIDARQDGYESTYNSCESGCMGRQTLDGSNEQYYNETFKSL